jgi:glutamate formiminotransferase
MIECVPNLSEGRRAAVLDAIARAIDEVAGVRLLDVSSDASHNRSVFTMVGERAPLVEAVMALFDRALTHIDLTVHRGEHPRIGAVDVVPFVPLGGTVMADCVALARSVGSVVADRYRVPVYLYEHAASTPARRHLEDIRRGQFEALAAKMENPDWVPDFGPRRPHPTAGATAVGARGALIAYNVNLATDRIDVAQRIAAAIRQRGGGLPGVKAIGVRLAARGLVQVSTNLTNYRMTGLSAVYSAVEREAAQHGVAVVESEIVGLVPADALPDEPVPTLRLRDFGPHRILENRL